MFREFALDPAVISGWERARFFLDAFGPSKGRFLAELPNDWLGQVYRQLTCKDTEKKRVEAKLIQLMRDKRLFSARQCGRPPQGTPWLNAALAEHSIAPFHAIIANAPPAHPDVLDADTLDDNEPRWDVPNGAFVARDARSIVAAIQLLVARSKRIIWIDPYFRASTSARRAVFIELCRTLPSGCTVSVHVGLGRSDDPDFDAYRSGLLEDLPKHVACDVSVQINCWSQRTNGERLHNRFVLTDVGGIKFGDSIAQGTQTGEEDHLNILDEPSRLRLIESYASDKPAFDRVGEAFEVKGTLRRR